MVYILQNVFVSSKRLAFNVHFYRHRDVFFFFVNDKREETLDGRYRSTLFRIGKSQRCYWQRKKNVLYRSTRMTWWINEDGINGR